NARTRTAARNVCRITKVRAAATRGRFKHWRHTGMASAMAGIVALKDVHAQLKTRMEKTVEDFRANLLSTRTGRASVHMLDQVKVDYYGTDTPLSQVAQISTPEAQLILVKPWEKTMVGPIEKAIRTSG